jgi:hypothetical protein
MSALSREYATYKIFMKNLLSLIKMSIKYYACMLTKLIIRLEYLWTVSHFTKYVDVDRTGKFE